MIILNYFLKCFVIFLFFILGSWEGSGDKEIGREKETGIIRIKVDPEFYRPTEVVRLSKSRINRFIIKFIHFKFISIGHTSWRLYQS